MTIVHKLIAAAVGLAMLVLGVMWGIHAIHADGEEAGKLTERAVWQAKERKLLLDQAKLRADHTAEMRRIAGIHQQVNEKVSTDHDQEIADLRAGRDADVRAAERRGGLRIPASVCRGETGTGTEAARDGGRDEAGAGTVRLPQQVETDLWALAGDADEVSAQLRACQSWIVNQGFYGAPPAN